MTTDTSAEALEKLASKTMPGDYEMVSVVGEMRKTLRALAAEKRRAREGVTDENVQRFLDAWPLDPHGMFLRVSPQRVWKALEAVWPDGRDAKDAQRWRTFIEHPDWLKRFPKGKWAFVWPLTNYEYEVFNSPTDAIDAAMKDTDHD